MNMHHFVLTGYRNGGQILKGNSSSAPVLMLVVGMRSTLTDNSDVQGKKRGCAWIAKLTEPAGLTQVSMGDEQRGRERVGGGGGGG